jgi:hypothetical protein
MRTTVDLPDELLRQIKAKAALEGMTLKELLTAYIFSGLRQPTPSKAATPRSKIPVIKRSGKSRIPNVTPELQAQLEEEEDFEKLRRSFGR